MSKKSENKNFDMSKRLMGNSHHFLQKISLISRVIIRYFSTLQSFDLAKRKGFVVVKPRTRRYPLINSFRNLCDALGQPNIRVEQVTQMKHDFRARTIFGVSKHMHIKKNFLICICLRDIITSILSSLLTTKACPSVCIITSIHS